MFLFPLQNSNKQGSGRSSADKGNHLTTEELQTEDSCPFYGLMQDRGGRTRSRKVLSQSGGKYLSQGPWARNVDVHMSLTGPGPAVGVGNQSLTTHLSEKLQCICCAPNLDWEGWFPPWGPTDKASLGFQRHTEDFGLDQTPQREVYLVKMEKIYMGQESERKKGITWRYVGMMASLKCTFLGERRGLLVWSQRVCWVWELGFLWQPHLTSSIGGRDVFTFGALALAQVMTNARVT